MIRIIIDYLQTNKRLVIPQLGALLVKEPTREILFSELIRRDDGVLRTLLMDQCGMNELTAQGEIDRLVFEIRHAVEVGGEYHADGLGLFFAGANSTIAFRAESASERVEVAPAVSKPAPEPTKVEPKVEEQLEEQPQEESAEEQPQEESQEESQDELQEEELHLTTSAKMNPAPYVKGLSYGKPPKNTDAFTYVDRPQRRGGVDTFLVVAIVAVLIALGAIAYGYYHDWQEQRAAEASIEQLESLTTLTDEATEAVPTTAPDATN